MQHFVNLYLNTEKFHSVWNAGVVQFSCILIRRHCTKLKSARLHSADFNRSKNALFHWNQKKNTFSFSIIRWKEVYQPKKKQFNVLSNEFDLHEMNSVWAALHKCNWKIVPFRSFVRLDDVSRWKYRCIKWKTAQTTIVDVIKCYQLHSGKSKFSIIVYSRFLEQFFQCDKCRKIKKIVVNGSPF